MTISAVLSIFGAVPETVTINDCPQSPPCKFRRDRGADASGEPVFKVDLSRHCVLCVEVLRITLRGARVRIVELYPAAATAGGVGAA